MRLLASLMTDSQHVDVPPLSNETIAALLVRRAREQPDQVYCTFGEDATTFAALDARVNQIANLLTAKGLRQGDRVAVMLPGHPDHLFVIFALAKLGLVRVPVNVHLIGAPLAHVFEQLQPQALIADVAYAGVVQVHADTLKTVLWRGVAGQGLDACVDQPVTAPDVVVMPDDIIGLTPSSGTTGLPKGVLKSDRHLRAGPQAILRLTGAGPGDVFLFWEALHHGAGVAVAIAALVGGFRLAMIERFSASRFWDDVRRLDVTHIHYLGSVLPMLLKQPPKDTDREHRVRIAWGGGCPADIWHAFSERFGVAMREGYGLSELITFVTLNPDGPAGSIGKPISYFDVRLTNDAGDAVPVGDAGEITIRATAPGLGFLGYYNQADAEASSRRGEWFCTGDLATQDGDGFLFYAGRKKDMLRRRGINISAWEVERIMSEHDAVEETALIGVPSDLGEDELKLFVRLREGRQLEPLELIKWSAERLPYFQVPRYVTFIAEFPKTPTQRIQKKELSREVRGVWDVETTGYRIGKS